jgi:hypothetical protein
MAKLGSFVTGGSRMKKILLGYVIRIHSLDGLFFKLPKAHRILFNPIVLLLLILVLIIATQSHATSYTYIGTPLTDTKGTFYYPYDYDQFIFHGGPNPATGSPITITLTCDGTLADHRVNNYANVFWTVTFGTTAGTKTLRKGDKSSGDPSYPYGCSIDIALSSASGLPASWTIDLDASNAGYVIFTSSSSAFSLANQYEPETPPYNGPADWVSVFNGQRGIVTYKLGSPGKWSFRRPLPSIIPLLLP